MPVRNENITLHYKQTNLNVIRIPERKWIQFILHVHTCIESKMQIIFVIVYAFPTRFYKKMNDAYYAGFAQRIMCCANNIKIPHLRTIKTH